MSVLDEIRKVFIPSASYVTGKVVTVKGDRVLVSTIKGQLDCKNNLISTLGEGDQVHIENNVVVGKLRPESALKRYYI